MTNRFENNILGFVKPEDLLDVGFEVRRAYDPIDELFGDERTSNLFARWQTIAAEYQVPMMAQFHAFDTEAQTTFRVPVDSHNVEKGLIKVKLNQSERLRELMRSGVREDELYDFVMNDGMRLVDQVVTRSKVAKNELMATGRVTIKENNLDTTVDYGVAEEQTAFSLDLSSHADIVGQLQSILDAAAAKGITLNGMMTSKKNLGKLRRNIGLQTLINGSIGAGALVTNAQLYALLESEFGLATVIVNDLTYGVPGGMDANGRPMVAAKRYYPEDKITFFAANPNGKMGTGLWGEPPEVDAGGFFSVDMGGESPFVYTMQWMEKDPAVLWTKASALFMPVLYNPASLWIATVDNTPTLGELTVTSVAGTKTGDTKLTVTPGKENPGNVYKVKAASGTAPAVTYGQNVKNWKTWDGSSDLTLTGGYKVTVAEADGAGLAQNAGSATVVVKS